MWRVMRINAVHLDLVFTRVAVAFTLFATVMFFLSEASLVTAAFSANSLWRTGEVLFFSLLVVFLVYGNLVYQGARFGYLKRRLRHVGVEREALLRFYEQSAPPVTIVIPSYKEEASVIRQTLLSAALQQYPHKRIVLLVDDPPEPSSPQDRATLTVARGLPLEVEALLSGVAKTIAAVSAQFHDRHVRGRLDFADEARILADCYCHVSRWFDEQAATYPMVTHTDRWFVQKIFREPARQHEGRAKELVVRAALGSSAGTDNWAQRFHAEYKALATLFQANVALFERKRYQNLSHEPNKAMNLNSYLALMGKYWLEVRRPDGLHLEEAQPGNGAWIPDTPYVITVDADSILLSDYALRLIDVMEQPHHERIAVAQTPYSAVPDAPGILERTAGATTDIQYFSHQGFTAYGATFWVGANALLRKAALDDICVVERKGRMTIRRYIQDHTVIEDTESTVDLLQKGWQLFNYPERLAYSATPRDFGALTIQRGRWANGGLLILPKLLTHWRTAPKRRTLFAQGFHQLYYLTSLAAAPLSVLLLVAIPFSPELVNIWLPLTALPYFLLYARDLHLAGYPAIRTLVDVYALNLSLIPVHLRGALNSLKQAWSGRKSAFERTPKIAGRTRVPASIICWEYVMPALCLALALIHATADRWPSAVVALLNGAVVSYAISRFLGISETVDDLRQAWEVGLLGRLHPLLQWLQSDRTTVALWREAPRLCKRASRGVWSQHGLTFMASGLTVLLSVLSPTPLQGDEPMEGTPVQTKDIRLSGTAWQLERSCAGQRVQTDQSGIGHVVPAGDCRRQHRASPTRIVKRKAQIESHQVPL